MGITCDRCGREMDDRWEIEGMPGDGGVCEVCGESLCAECSDWNDEGLCRYCAMSVEELEFLLPLSVQRREKRESPCPGCKKEFYQTVTYNQHILRNDNYGTSGKCKKRWYEIQYGEWSANKLLYTDRFYTFREALIDAHKKLDRLGIKVAERRGK